MKDTIYKKVKKFIEEHHMIETGDLVVVGVSGGADSVCLLHLLHRFSKETSYSLVAVHVNHGVRAEASADAAYTRELCERLGVPFVLYEVDMIGYAAAHKLSSEEAGRQLRYRAFEEVMERQWRAQQELQGQQKQLTGKIAVAHNAEDRAETMLFHLFRGTGMKGLASIKPVRDHIIRPVLCLERAEIEAYLAAQGLEYCLDATNETDAYTRNKIRHHIIAYARQEICVGAVAHMSELADMLSETERYLSAQAGRLYETYVEEVASEEAGFDKQDCAKSFLEEIKCGQQPERLRVQGTELLKQDAVMYQRVLLMCMERLTPHRKDITGQHIADIVKFMAGGGSKELSLPYGIKAYKEYGMLILDRNSGRNDNHTLSGGAASKVYTIEPPTEIIVPGGGIFKFTLLENNAQNSEEWQNIRENRYTKRFDYDKISTVVLRTRQPGDYLTIDSALHTKSVKQYMINEKIPKFERDSIYLLADGSHVLWIPGYRISERCKVEESTKRILQVRLRGGRHGRTN